MLDSNIFHFSLLKNHAMIFCNAYITFCRLADWNFQMQINGCSKCLTVLVSKASVIGGCSGCGVVNGISGTIQYYLINSYPASLLSLQLSQLEMALGDTAQL